MKHRKICPRCSKTMNRRMVREYVRGKGRVLVADGYQCRHCGLVKPNPFRDESIRKQDADALRYWLTQLYDHPVPTQRIQVLTRLVKEIQAGNEKFELIHKLIKYIDIESELKYVLGSMAKKRQNPKKRQKRRRVSQWVVKDDGGVRINLPSYNPVKNGYSEPQGGSAGNLYRSFHGNPPKSSRTVQYDPPTNPLIKWGKISQINYIPEKPSQHTGVEFYHKFGDYGSSMKFGKHKPILATDAKGKNLYIIKDKSSFHLTERGIIG